VVALDAKTVAHLVLSTIHHDLGIMICSRRPIFVPVVKDGQKIDRWPQTSKVGFLLFIERETGHPYIPSSEDGAAQDIPGEESWRDQPFLRNRRLDSPAVI